MACTISALYYNYYCTAVNLSRVPKSVVTENRTTSEMFNDYNMFEREKDEKNVCDAFDTGVVKKNEKKKKEKIIDVENTIVRVRSHCSQSLVESILIIIRASR